MARRIRRLSAVRCRFAQRVSFARAAAHQPVRRWSLAHAGFGDAARQTGLSRYRSRPRPHLRWAARLRCDEARGDGSELCRRRIRPQADRDRPPRLHPVVRARQRRQVRSAMGDVSARHRRLRCQEGRDSVAARARCGGRRCPHALAEMAHCRSGARGYRLLHFCRFWRLRRCRCHRGGNPRARFPCVPRSCDLGRDSASRASRHRRFAGIFSCDVLRNVSAH